MKQNEQKRRKILRNVFSLFDILLRFSCSKKAIVGFVHRFNWFSFFNIQTSYLSCLPLFEQLNGSSDSKWDEHQQSKATKFSFHMLIDPSNRAARIQFQISKMKSFRLVRTYIDGCSDSDHCTIWAIERIVNHKNKRVRALFFIKTPCKTCEVISGQVCPLCRLTIPRYELCSWFDVV